MIESSDSESDDPKPKSRNGVNKRQRVSGNTKLANVAPKRILPPGSDIPPSSSEFVVRKRFLGGLVCILPS